MKIPVLKNLIFNLLLLSTLSACAQQPTVDATSLETLQSSFEIIRESVPQEKREAFRSAWEVIAAEKARQLFLGTFTEGSPDKEPDLLTLMQDLNGKTADDIIQMATEIKQAQE